MSNNMWNGADFSMFDEYIFRDDVHRLCVAMEEGNYPAFYGELRKREGLFARKEAHKLCKTAIQNGFTKKAFETLLGKCPPVDLFRYEEPCDHIFGHGLDIPGYAAMFDRADLLEVMLVQDIEIDHYFQWCSILEASLEACSIDCVELMLAQEGLNIPITEQLLYIWGDVGKAPISDICYASVASRIFDCHIDLNVEEVPLLPGMKTYHAISRYNWPLFRRICREIGEEAINKRYVSELVATILYDSEDNLENLDALLTAYPNALRKEKVRSHLVTYALHGPDKVDETLKKWLDRMHGGMVVMNCFNHFSGSWYRELDGLTMAKWEDKIGTQLVPALSRTKGLPSVPDLFYGTWDDRIRWMMDSFKVKGRGRKGEISELAAHLLLVSSPAMTREVLERGFVLDTEDPEEMMNYCERMEEFQKRYLIAAYLRKEDDYDF